jgi:hypothetical protein
MPRKRPEYDKTRYTIERRNEDRSVSVYDSTMKEWVPIAEAVEELAKRKR